MCGKYYKLLGDVYGMPVPHPLFIFSNHSMIWCGVSALVRAYSGWSCGVMACTFSIVGLGGSGPRAFVLFFEASGRA